MNNLKKFFEEKFDDMIRRNKELINWLSDLFMRKAEERRKDEYDSEDDLKARLIEVLKNKIDKIENPKEREKLIDLLNKWSSNHQDSNNGKNGSKSSKKSIIENLEERIKEAIREKELTKQKQRDNLIKLTDKIEQFFQQTRSRQAEKLRELKNKINETIKETKTTFSERLDDLRTSVQELLNNKFNQIKNNFNQDKLNDALKDIENKVTNILDQRKEQRNERLNEIRDLMNKLVDDNNLISSERARKLEEIKTKLNNWLDKEEEIDGTKSGNEHNSKLGEIIESLPNESVSNEFGTADETTNDEQLQVEKIKDKLRAIESKIVDYLKKNQDNKAQIEEDLAKFNEFVRSNKKISVGILTRIARLIDNEEIREEIKDIIKNVIDFAKQNSLNLITVESDLNALVSEIEETNKNVSSKQFDLTKFENGLVKTNQAKLLKASNPLGEAPAFSPKVFGITVAIVAATMVFIAITCVIYRKFQKRKNYTRV